jgi:ammonium transporter Rh
VDFCSDVFAMIGTLFLWVYWPSFVAVYAEGNAQNRAVINTVFSISASCLSACVVSSLLRPGRKICMVDVQNATLAGGVSIGAVADHALGGGGALLVGVVAGSLSTVGYVYIQPWLEEHMDLSDTCGVHNLHGMPGVIGALAAVVSSSQATRALYGDNIGDVFARMEDGGRSRQTQAWYQLGSLLLTMLIAMSSGIFAGIVMRHFGSPKAFFSDNSAFEVPDEFQDMWGDEESESVDFTKPKTASAKSPLSNEELERGARL